jgi:hypothetical protein
MLTAVALVKSSREMSRAIIFLASPSMRLLVAVEVEPGWKTATVDSTSLARPLSEQLCTVNELRAG